MKIGYKKVYPLRSTYVLAKFHDNLYIRFSYAYVDILALTCS